MSKDALFVGVDLGGTNVTAGVVDASHQVVAREKKKTKAERGEEQVVQRIAKCVRAAIDAAGCKLDEIGGVCIGAPGAIDQNKGEVINAVNLRWNDYPLAQILSDELKRPVTLDNDVNVGTWGEHVAGAGKEFNDMLGIFVGTGIGGGLVLGGKLYHGFHHTAGEIGHTVLNADAPLGYRTLEKRASRTAVANTLKALVLANYESALPELTDGDLDTIRSGVLRDAVGAGDALTIEVLRQSAYYVGVAIANTLTLLSLPCAVVGGGLTEAVGEPYLEWVTDAFRKHVFPKTLQSCTIAASTLGDDAGVVGAAALARERLG